MALSLADTATLAAKCAPAVAPQTLLSIVAVESGFEPLAIGVNGTPRIVVTAANPADATAKAAALIAQGRSVDLGLAQINSRNLAALGLDVAAAFDPCRNLSASADLLARDYGRSAPDLVGAQAALRAALSYNNTGDPRRGLANRYVAKVTAAANHIVPAIAATPDAAAAPLAVPTPPPPPAWDVFGQARPAGFVIRISSQPAGATP
jgi:type IV secretion system protein VirB1